jgi:hypothetical protein
MPFQPSVHPHFRGLDSVGKATESLQVRYIERIIERMGTWE